MSLRGLESVVTTSELAKLAVCYEHIAAQSLKGVILLEKHRQKIEQNPKQEMKLSM